MSDVTDPPRLLDFGTIEEFTDADTVLAALGSPRFQSSRWVFRGQPSADWSLQPTLERFAKYIREFPPLAIEPYIRREFRRRAHHYSNSLPADDNNLEWLALMRHHGAPTRLLDFSKSPYVAAFFAAAEARRDESVANWAVDAHALRRYSTMMLAEFIGTKVLFNIQVDESPLVFSDQRVFNVLLQPRDLRGPRVVVPVEPFRMNQRMLLQGVFLCPGFIEYEFEASLAILAR